MATGIFPPDIGGPATHAADLARTLRARGHQVVVLSLTDGERTGPDAEVVLLPRRWPWPVRTAAAARWLVRHRHRYDVVYATGLDLPAVGGARLARRPVVLKVPGDPAWERGRRHGLTAADFDEFQDARGGPVRLRAMRGVRNWAVRNATAVVVPSRYLEGVVERWCGGRTPVTVVQNGVREPDPTSAGAHPGGPATQGLRLVYVGRLVAHKRIEILLEALALVDASVTLDIVGTGPEMDALHARCDGLGLGPRVRFVGNLEHDEVMAGLVAADALVSATSYEGLPHVVIEALVCGTPVVTTPAGGVIEVISEGVNGRLVADADPVAFAAVFDELLHDAGQRGRLAAGAAESGRAWGFERCATQVETLLSGLLLSVESGPSSGGPSSGGTAVAGKNQGIGR